MKNRIISIVLSTALFLFFTGTSAFAQIKPEKKETKIEKPVEPKVVQKETKDNMNKKSSMKETTNLGVSKENKGAGNEYAKTKMTKESSQKKQHKMHKTSNKKAVKASTPVKTETNEKVK